MEKNKHKENQKKISLLILFWLYLLFSSTTQIKSANPHSFDFNGISEETENILSSKLNIKIKIASTLSNFTIGVSKDGFIQDSANHKYWLYPLSKYQVKLNSKGNYDLILSKKNQVKTIRDLIPPFSISAYKTSIFLNNHWYRGEIAFTNSITGLTAINSLPLDYALMGITGPFIQEDDSDEAIKAGIIIMRSSLVSMSPLESKQHYHLNASDLSYIGVDGEKDFANQMVKETEGQVLFNQNGEIIYTPLRSAMTETSTPFELIGKQSRAWEKILTLSQMEQMLERGGFNIGNIISLEAQPLSQNNKAPTSEGLNITIKGVNGTAQINKIEAQKIFDLPSHIFRVYFFTNYEGETHFQFIGSLLNAPNTNYPDKAVFNLIRLIHETSDPYWTYIQILKDIYPSSYLGKI